MLRPLRYGLIGCGVFGRFCLEQFRRLADIELVAVADIDQTQAERLAAEFNMESSPTPESLLARPDIDIVHLAVPPFTHSTLGIAALHAGKHVLCEKPLAVTMSDGAAMVNLAAKKGLVLAVNLMMRYNPLCHVVKRLIESKVLGAPLHAHFVNDARDEYLPSGHWFWKPELSGGIFVEHGVHFFDLFEWWLGPGKLLAAQQAARPGSGVIEHVNATVLYRDSVLVNFYHGFHQAACRDHQEWMIVFENGTLRMLEWVPTSMEIDFIGTAATAARLRELCDGEQPVRRATFTEGERSYQSRHQRREADGRYVLTLPDRISKTDVYGHMVRGLLQDQIAAIRKPGYRPLVNEQNGLDSLAIAVAAQQLASRTL